MRATDRSIALSLALLIVGCAGGDRGPELGEVTGQLLKAGEPVANGWVEFHPTSSHRPSVARTNNKGKFTLTYSAQKEGAVVGTHTVKVGTGGEEVEDPEAQGGFSVTKRKPFDFTMTAEVSAGQNEINIEVP